MSENDILNSFFDENFIMRLTGYSKKTIDNLRSSGSPRIPPSVKLGMRWVYPKKEFADWAKRSGYPFSLR